jgi:hypothetical protein
MIDRLKATFFTSATFSNRAFLIGLTDSLISSATRGTKQGGCDYCSITSVLMKSLQPPIGKSRPFRENKDLEVKPRLSKTLSNIEETLSNKECPWGPLALIV